MNKRGQSFSGISDIALTLVIFVLALGTIGIGFYYEYNDNRDLTFGFSTNDTISKYTDLQGTIQTSTDSGQATFTSDQGLTLSSLWGIVKASYSTVVSFASGSFITRASNLIGLPGYVGVILRLMFIIGVGYLLIRLLTKVDKT